MNRLLPRLPATVSVDVRHARASMFHSSSYCIDCIHRIPLPGTPHV